MTAPARNTPLIHSIPGPSFSHATAAAIAKVLFVSARGAGRAQIAAAFFNQLANAGLARAVFAGIRPSAHVHPEILGAMREVGVRIPLFTSLPITPELARDASWLVTLGCRDECSAAPGAQQEEWPVADPADQPLDVVRHIRDAIRARVWSLIVREGWWRFGQSPF